MRGFLGLMVALFWASAGVAAPFDCARSTFGVTSGVAFGYDVNRVDRIADVELFSEGAPMARECGFGGTGRINTISGSGLVTLRGEYVVTVRGNLGTSLFDEDFSDFEDVNGISGFPPNHRIDFRPLGGRNLDFLYPNGFSVTYNDNSEGPFFLFNIEDGVVTSLSSRFASYTIAAVPLPAAFPLALAAFGVLGWVGRSKRR